MTDFAAAPLSQTELNRALAQRLSVFALWCGAFISGFVMSEPAPYELYMAGLIGVWALVGLRFSRTIMPVFVVMIVFNVGALISMTQMDNWTGAPMYIAVSFFLAGTTLFFAAVIEEDYRRLEPIFNGWLAAAAIGAVLGIIGYFGVGGETFTRYGRAKGAFQDPNVFAPYLMLPALYCLYQVLMRPLVRSTIMLPLLLLLTLGVFFSFSRAAWGMYTLSIMMLVGYLLLINPSNRFRLRILLLSIAAIIFVVVALLVALQIESVASMLVERAQLVQDYDGARLGRFARHWIGYELASRHPFGIGILQFSGLYGEDQHNVYLKVLLDYSWLGFAGYVMLIVMTLAAGFKILFRDRPWRSFLVCTYIVFIGHAVIGNIIDTDHWRHWFLLLGIIWGCVGAEVRWQSMRRA